MKCAVCKAEMASDLTFCTECGAKRDESKAEEAFFAGSSEFAASAGSNRGVVSTGPLPGNYEVLGMVSAHVDNTDSEPVDSGCACGGPTDQRVYVSIDETYRRGSSGLLRKAKHLGGHSVVYARFEHRVAIETLQNPGGALLQAFGNKSSSNTVTNQVIELFCSGTAVRIVD